MEADVRQSVVTGLPLEALRADYEASQQVDQVQRADETSIPPPKSTLKSTSDTIPSRSPISIPAIYPARVQVHVEQAGGGTNAEQHSPEAKPMDKDLIPPSDNTGADSVPVTPISPSRHGDGDNDTVKLRQEEEDGVNSEDELEMGIKGVYFVGPDGQEVQLSV